MKDPNFPQDVAEFREAAGLKNSQTPRLLEGRLPFDKMIEHLQAAYVLTKLVSQSDGELALRIGLIIDEVTELVEAARDQDLVKMLDAQLDTIYVVLDMGIAQGLPMNLGWEEVHRTNMNKVRDGQKVDASGKIMKPEGWEGPEAKLKELIATLLQRRWMQLEEPVVEAELLPPESPSDGTYEEIVDASEGQDSEAGGSAEDHGGGSGGLYGKW